MTVIDAVKLLQNMDTFHLCFNGSLYDYDPTDFLHRKAFGNFDVSAIKRSYENGEVELELAVSLMKDGVPV